MDTKKKHWERKEVFNLISKFKQHPELWESKHRDYKNRVKKRMALLSIASDLDTNIGEVMRKLHNLKSQCAQEAKKRYKFKKDGVDWDTKWEYFKPLRFLVDAQQESSAKRESVIEVLVDGNSEQSNDNDDFKEEQSDSDSPSPEPKRGAKIERCYEEGNKEDVVNNVIDISEQNEDEFKIFADYVANEIKNMHYDSNRRELKRLIQRQIISMTEKDDREYFGSIK